MYIEKIDQFHVFLFLTASDVVRLESCKPEQPEDPESRKAGMTGMAGNRNVKN